MVWHDGRIWTVHWIMVGCLLNTGSYTVTTLKTQRFVYAIWGLCKDSGVSQYGVMHPQSITKSYDFCVLSFSSCAILLRVKWTKWRGSPLSRDE